MKYLVISVVAGLLIVSAGCKEEPKHAASSSPPEVEVIIATQRDVPISTEWVGSLDGVVNATIRAQVSGYLIKQSYLEGAPVRKGDVLFEIDPRPFQAALDKAKGDQAVQEAQLAKATQDVNRYGPLVREQAISQQEYDYAVQAKQSAEASLISAKAAVDQAALNLSFTKVTSPIDGIAGIAIPGLGDLLSQSMTLTTVSTVDPIRGYFAISEQQYLWGIDHLQKTQTSSANNNLTLILANGAEYPHKGHFVLVDRQVDPHTGSLRVGAEFPNPGNMLRPGQFARVRATLRVKTGAVLVPQRAIYELQGKYLIAVVGADNIAIVRPVKVSERIGSEWIVEAGLKPGETVVVEGFMKVGQGGKAVTPKPFQPAVAVEASAGKPESR